MENNISHGDWQKLASENADTLLEQVVQYIVDKAGGSLTAESMARLSAEQLTLWGYYILRDELMDGGFIQLIHNGYGPFFFKNPFAKMMKTWNLADLAKLINRANKLDAVYGQEIVKECTDEEFMALFERFPDFDNLDDEFVENEEMFTNRIADYVREHWELFVTPSETDKPTD